MLSYLFFFLAGSANAFMDTFLFRADRSIFKHIGIEKLSPMYTWMTYKNFLGIVRLDPWHIAKYFWLGFTILAVYFYKPFLGGWDIIMFSLCWHFGFELFWSKILYKP